MSLSKIISLSEIQLFNFSITLKDGDFFILAVYVILPSTFFLTGIVLYTDFLKYFINQSINLSRQRLSQSLFLPGDSWGIVGSLCCFLQDLWIVSTNYKSTCLTVTMTFHAIAYQDFFLLQWRVSFKRFRLSVVYLKKGLNCFSQNRIYYLYSRLLLFLTLSC